MLPANKLPFLCCRYDTSGLIVTTALDRVKREGRRFPRMRCFEKADSERQLKQRVARSGVGGEDRPDTRSDGGAL